MAIPGAPGVAFFSFVNNPFQYIFWQLPVIRRDSLGYTIFIKALIDIGSGVPHWLLLPASHVDELTTYQRRRVRLITVR